MSKRKGDYCRTQSGIAFYPLDPRPDEIDIEDIAHALSQICRFTGHSKVFYSVAEHCVRVSRIVPQEFQLKGLLHDASEAYLSDIARPLKKQHDFHRYKEIEALLERMIFQKFGVDLGVSDEGRITNADLQMLSTEMRDVTNFPFVDREKLPTPLEHRISAWSPYQAKNMFLVRFYELTNHPEYA